MFGCLTSDLGRKGSAYLRRFVFLHGVDIFNKVEFSDLLRPFKKLNVNLCMV